MRGSRDEKEDGLGAHQDACALACSRDGWGSAAAVAAVAAAELASRRRADAARRFPLSSSFIYFFSSFLRGSTFFWDCST